MEIAKISASGQITLPREIRKKLNVNEGDKVVFIEDEGRIVVDSVGNMFLVKAAENNSKKPK